jgi:Tfp pilus assembly protein PilN
MVMASDQALLRIADLPTTDQAELPGMVELQIDRFSPFPVDHLVVAHETLRVGSDRTRVLMAAIHRDAVEREAAAMKAAGLDVRRVDLDILGWWHQLRESGIAESPGLRLHMIMDMSSVMVLAVQDGLPVLVRALGRGIGVDTPQDIEDELNATLTALETEWGLGDGAAVTAWFGGAPPSDWANRLSAACGLPVRCRSMDDLPPITEGVARRAAAASGTALNLAPAEWETERVSRASGRRLIVAAAACIGLWLAAVTAFLIALAIRESGINRIKTRVDVLEQPASEVRALQTRIRTLEDYGDRSRSALELMRQVSEDLPEGLSLTSLIFKKGRSVSLRGDAESVNPVYDFFAAMERSGLYVRIKPEGVTSKAAGGRARAEFRVTGILPGGEDLP